MSQAPLWNVPTAGPGNMPAFAARASAALDAELTCHSGASRPAYAVPNTIWHKIVSAAAWERYLFDGAEDILIGTFNPISNTFTLAPTALGFPVDTVMRNDQPTLAFVNGRVVATQGAAGEGAIELRGSSTPPYDGGTINWTQGSTGASQFKLVNDGASALRILDGEGNEVLKIQSNGDVRSKLFGSLAEQIIPVGTIIVGPWTAAPTGFLKWNGAVLSRTTYSRLWAHALASGKLVSEAAWGAGNYGCYSTGDGSTTFRIGSAVNSFIRMLTDDNAGGYPVGLYYSDRFAAHGHGVNDPAHAHGNSNNPLRSGTFAIGAGGPPTALSANSGGVANWTSDYAGTGIYLSAAGSGSETFPRSIPLIACIKY